MAEVFYFHVQEDRSIKYKLPEPIMQEDKDVATWRFRIPKVLNNIDMSAWSWWFVYVNAKGQEYSELLTLTDDIDEPSSYSTADYDIDYGISKFPGSFSFALEAISTEQGSEISGEWHTRTYSHKVDKTLQGNQAEYSETESDVISALMQEVRNKVNQLVGGATPLPVNLKSLMTDHDKVYLYTGSEPNESTGYWYYWNGVRFTPGGVYGAGDPESVQGYVENWLDNHPEATTTVQNGTITEAKLADSLKLKTIKDYVTPEMFGAVGDGLADDTDAIQNAIDNSPNKTILFSKKYIVSSTIVTSANENEKVFLKLNSGAIIKASDNFLGNFVIDIGGSGNRTSIHDTLYITGIDGGTIDTNGVCGGVLVERTQMAKITNLSIINVGAYVGFRIDKPSEENSVNSSDAYVENIVVTGEDSNIESCTGLIINGHDNDIRNVRTNFVNVGIVINGSHNRISNAHPLRGASDTENNYSVYETSRAFVINNNQIYLIDCYSDNFAVGIEVKAGCIFFTYGFTLLWYESYNVTHTFIKIVDDGETLTSTKLFWGHVYGADLLFKAAGTNTGIDGDFLEASYARNSNCFSELYINNRTTLDTGDPLLDRRFNTNKIIDYNYDPVTIDSLDQIGEGTSGRVNFSAEASPTGVAAIYIFSCTGDSTRKQITVISPSNNVVYTNIYNGSWGQWKTYQFNNGFTTPESTDAITDLSTIRCGEMGRARFAAAVSPTGQAGVFIYECIGGDESRKILIAYLPSNKNRYINSYTGSWTGWATM